MKLNWNNSAGWALIVGAVLFLTMFRRLDLLLVVVPLSILLGYGMARVKSGGATQQR